jgi:hypothetical protein
MNAIWKLMMTKMVTGEKHKVISDSVRFWHFHSSAAEGSSPLACYTMSAGIQFSLYQTDKFNINRISTQRIVSFQKENADTATANTNNNNNNNLQNICNCKS